MASTEERYTSEIKRDLGYLATWLPNEPVELGAYGRMDGDTFRREGNIADFGVTFTALATGTSADIKHQSASGVDISFQGKADGPIIPEIPSGQAGVKITFKETDAIVLVTKGAVNTPIADLADAQRQILALSDPNALHGKTVIGSVVTAGATTVLIASSSEASLAMTAKADLSDVSDLANVSLGLSVRHERDVSTQIIAQPGLTPLLQAFRVQRWGFGGPGVHPESMISGDDIGSPSGDGGFEWLTQRPRA